MALGIVGAYGLTKKEMTDCLFVGELSLDGGIRGVCGALPIAIEARGQGISRMVVPEANAKEAAMACGLHVYPVRSLLDVIHFVNSGNGIAPIKAPPPRTKDVAEAIQYRSLDRTYWAYVADRSNAKMREAPKNVGAAAPGCPSSAARLCALQ